MIKRNREECFPGDIIPQFYADVSMDKVPDCYLPRSEVGYITTLLNHKFGIRLSYQAVAKFLEEEFKKSS